MLTNSVSITSLSVLQNFNLWLISCRNSVQMQSHPCMPFENDDAVPFNHFQTISKLPVLQVLQSSLFDKFSCISEDIVDVQREVSPASLKAQHGGDN